MAAELLKLVVVGDGSVGKSCMLITFTTNAFPGEYVPTVFDHYVLDQTVNGKRYNISLWDTAGQEDYDRLRPLAYPQTDIFLVCFNVASRTSFENVQQQWIPEISHHCNHAPRILVGCKSDLRSSNPERDFVTAKEAKRLAAKLQCCQYLETSSLHQKGLTVLFDAALEAAMIHKKKSKQMNKRSFFSILKKKEENGPLVVCLPPAMPPAGFAPQVEIKTCTRGEQWLAMLHRALCPDTVLVLSSGEEILTHRIILASASSVFRKAQGIKATKAHRKGQSSSLYKFEHPAILQVDWSHAPQSTYIYLSDLVTPEILQYGLEFFYSGLVVFDGKPTNESLSSLRRFGQLMDEPFPEQICDNVEKGDEYLNPSIGTYRCDVVGQKVKELFFNQELDANPDVKFIFAGRSVYAHKCILSARNETMAAMFTGQFLEGNNEQITTVDMSTDPDADPVAFLAMLEFLYTGHTPLDEGMDPVSLLILSDRYNITRLTNLCELYITKFVDRKCSQRIEKADVDVIGLLNAANLYNAPQLSKWCRHFISTNYLIMSLRPEWFQLSDDDLQHIEEHRWPPVDYLNEVSEYEKLFKENQMKTRGSSSGSNDRSCLLM